MFQSLTFRRLLQNQIPKDYDDENDEYDGENGDNFDAYDDDSDFVVKIYPS